MEVDYTESELRGDVDAIQKIPIIKTILDVICRTTGMGFAAIARVTEHRWITCSANDLINFGLKPGDELKVETTICHEIRQHNRAVIIDDVDKDDNYVHHNTPLTYGFKSYISVPIIRKDGRFFGTLCAIDPKPAILNTPEVKGMFNLFADLISFHIGAVEQIAQTESNLVKERDERTTILERKNAELQKMNTELEDFAHVASHDLQEPLRKIQTFSNFIFDKDYDALSVTGKQYFDRLNKSVIRMQLLIKDLILYTKVKQHDQVFESIPLHAIVEEVRQSYSEELAQKHVTFEVGDMCVVRVIRFQFYQLLQNLVGNSIKFSRPGLEPVIRISACNETGDSSISDKLLQRNVYCHITISDNGIGFEPRHNEVIFKVFQRLNGREEFDGTGIGLSIVKKIVDNHKGYIAASGKENEGATFDIYIPQS